MPDILQAITMKQNVRFQVGISPEKFQLDQIQNSRPLAIIYHYNKTKYVVSGRDIA